jgi:hypothetical protein
MKSFEAVVRMAQASVPGVFVGLLALAHITALAAGTESLSLGVSATVLPHTQLEILSVPGSVGIKSSDIDCGFIDVETPVSVAVTSNNPRGAMLMLTTMSDYIEQASMSGLADNVVVSRGGGVVMVPSRGTGRQRTLLTLRFRLFLAKATPPGVHSWPIRLSTNVM